MSEIPPPAQTSHPKIVSARLSIGAVCGVFVAAPFLFLGVNAYPPPGECGFLCIPLFRSFLYFGIAVIAGLLGWFIAVKLIRFFFE
jgi:hypothetical protein